MLVNSLCFHSVGAVETDGTATTRLSAVFGCRATDCLTTMLNSDVVRLYGEHRYVANDVLRVSGSLTQGPGGAASDASA